MFLSNFHSHSYFCDGGRAPREYVRQAILDGLSVYGFSSHAPLPFHTSWSMRQQDVPRYVRHVKALQEQMSDIVQVLLGMEVDYIPNLTGPAHPTIAGYQLDFTIGAVHFAGQFGNGVYWQIDGSARHFAEGLQHIFDGDVRAAVSNYYGLVRQMTANQPPDIIAHLDKIKVHNREERYFSETESWYRQEVTETLEAIARSGAILEVNTRGLYSGATEALYPSFWVLQQARQLNIPVMINSDAHFPSEITRGYEEARAVLKEAGYSTIHVLRDKAWQEVALETGELIEAHR